MKNKSTLFCALFAATVCGGLSYATPPQISGSRPIAVGWWATDASNANWGSVQEVPRVGDYIRSAGSETSYRIVLKVATLADGNVRLRVGAPGSFE